MYINLRERENVKKDVVAACGVGSQLGEHNGSDDLYAVCHTHTYVSNQTTTGHGIFNNDFGLCKYLSVVLNKSL